MNETGAPPSTRERLSVFNTAVQSMMEVARHSFPMHTKSQTQHRVSISSSSWPSVQYFGAPNHRQDHRHNNDAVPMSSQITGQLAFRHQSNDDNCMMTTNPHATPNNPGSPICNTHTITTKTTPADGVVANISSTTTTTATPDRSSSFATPERTRPDPPVKKHTARQNRRINDNHDESFMRALNQAVTLALKNTTTTTTTSDNHPNNSCDEPDRYLVVVTHREGIRSLIDDCTKKMNSVRTPYCCVGTFTATALARDVDSHDISKNSLGTSEITYTFQNVSPYESFTL